MATTPKASRTAGKPATTGKAKATRGRKAAAPAVALPERQPGDDLDQEDYAQFDG